MAIIETFNILLINSGDLEEAVLEKNCLHSMAYRCGEIQPALW